MKILFGVIGGLLLSFLGLTLFLQQNLPAKVKETQARRSELLRINQLVDAQSKLTQFQNQRSTLSKALPELSATLTAISTLAAKHKATFAAALPDTQLSRPALNEWYVTGKVTANSLDDIKAFLTEIPTATKRVFLRNSTTTIQSDQPFETEIQFIIYAK